MHAAFTLKRSFLFNKNRLPVVASSDFAVAEAVVVDLLEVVAFSVVDSSQTVNALNVVLLKPVMMVVIKLQKEIAIMNFEY